MFRTFLPRPTQDLDCEESRSSLLGISIAKLDDYSLSVYYGFSDLALGITMASIGRPVFFAPILVAAVPGFSALAQEAAPVPRAPMTYGTDVRADNPHAPTPQFAPLVPGVYAREILNTKSSKGDYVVQIWSLLVSPKSSTNEVRLPGADRKSTRLNSSHTDISRMPSS